MIVQIINPFDTEEKYHSLYTLNLSRGTILSAELNLAINQPNQLNITFSANLPPKAFELLKENQYGLRIKKDGIDMLFIQDSQSKKITSQGLISCRFYSSIYKLKYMQPDLLYSQFINQSGIVIASQITGFDFDLISNDVTLSLNAGVNSQYDILKELRKASGSWSYFDTGLTPRGDGTYSNKIIIGDYNEINKYAAKDERFSTEKLETRNLRNFLSRDPILTDITTYFNGRQIQFLYAVLDTGQGAGTRNASPIFTKTDYEFVDPEFPLVDINGRIYIQDTRYTGIERRFYTYPITLPAVSIEADTEILNVNQALSYLYKKAVYYLKTQTESKRYDCDIAFKRLTFPKYLNIDYTHKVKNFLGQEVKTIDIKQDILYTNLTFDLSKL